MGLKSIKCCQGHTFIAKTFPRGVVDYYIFGEKLRVNPIFVGFYNTVFEGVKIVVLATKITVLARKSDRQLTINQTLSCLTTIDGEK